MGTGSPWWGRQWDCFDWLKGLGLVQAAAGRRRAAGRPPGAYLRVRRGLRCAPPLHRAAETAGTSRSARPQLSARALSPPVVVYVVRGRTRANREHGGG